jgi:hypothetical protein
MEDYLGYAHDEQMGRLVAGSAVWAPRAISEF